MFRRTQSIQAKSPDEELLYAVKSNCGDSQLLATLQNFPIDILRSFRDGRGNSVLQLVLSREIPVDEAIEPPSSGARRLIRRVSSLNGSRNHAFLKLLHFLLHCDDAPDEVADNARAYDILTRSRYQSLIRSKSSEGLLPLHTALRCKQRSNVVELLISEYRGALRMPDFRGDIPLHVACSGLVQLETIELLVQKWPEAVRVKNEDGNLPLHLLVAVALPKCNAEDLGATANSEKSGVKCELYRPSAYNPPPEAFTTSMQANPRGEFERRQLAIVEFLCDHFPDAIFQKNREGKSPLQIAQTNGIISVQNFLRNGEKEAHSTISIDPQYTAFLNIANPKSLTMSLSFDMNDDAFAEDPDGSYVSIDSIDDDDDDEEEICKSLQVTEVTGKTIDSSPITTTRTSLDAFLDEVEYSISTDWFENTGHARVREQYYEVQLSL